MQTAYLKLSFPLARDYEGDGGYVNVGPVRTMVSLRWMFLLLLLCLLDISIPCASLFDVHMVVFLKSHLRLLYFLLHVM